MLRLNQWDTRSFHYNRRCEFLRRRKIPTETFFQPHDPELPRADSLFLIPCDKSGVAMLLSDPVFANRGCKRPICTCPAL